MTYFIYLLFCATLFFASTIYLYYLYSNKTIFSFNLDNAEKPLPNEPKNINDIFFVKDVQSSNIKNEKIGLTDAEILLQLKRLNRQLSRNLKTLVYISKIEAKSKRNNSKDYLVEFFEFKKNIQREILKITKNIKHIKSLQINNFSE